MENHKWLQFRKEGDKHRGTTLAGEPQDGPSLLGEGEGMELIPGRQEPAQQQVANSKSHVNSLHSPSDNTCINHNQEKGH